MARPNFASRFGDIAPPRQSRAADHNVIAQQVEQFLAAGGSIQRIPIGMSGDQASYGHMSEEQRRQHIAALRAAQEAHRIAKLNSKPAKAATVSQFRNAWLPEEDALLLWLRAGGIPYDDIRRLLTRAPRTVAGMRARHSFLTREDRV